MKARTFLSVFAANVLFLMQGQFVWAVSDASSYGVMNPRFVSVTERNMDTGEVVQRWIDLSALPEPTPESLKEQPGEMPQPKNAGDMSEKALSEQDISDTRSLPWKTIYKLRIRPHTGASWQCSAWAYEEFHLVTIKDCVAEGTGWVKDIWAFPAAADLVAPAGELDYPYGEARVVSVLAYDCPGTANSYLCNKALLTLDRRLPQRLGRMGKDPGAPANTLHYAGYYSDANPGTSILLRNGTVHQTSYNPYTENKVFFEEFALVSASGGGGAPLWKEVNGNRYVQAMLAAPSSVVNEGTRLTSAQITAFNNKVANDKASSTLAPVNRPDLKEETFYYSHINKKKISTPVVGRQAKIKFNYNVHNAGFADSGPITVNFYLWRESMLNNIKVIGSTTLPGLAANDYVHIKDHEFRLPPDVQPGEYDLGWEMVSSNAEYSGMDYCSTGNIRPRCNNYAIVGKLTVLDRSDYNHTVIALAKGNGTISPSGVVSIEHGTKAIFTLTPSSGSQIKNVANNCGDGTRSGNTFTTGFITTNCTVIANFIDPSVDIFSDDFEG